MSSPRGALPGAPPPGRAALAILLVVGVLPACTGADGPADDTAGDTAPSEDLAATLPAPGPHGVGYSETSLVYTPDVPDAAPRTLRLALWYPTTATSGDLALYHGLWPSQVARDGAPVEEGAFPLVVFSHGHQGYAENSSFLMEHLASHGYVVAAPDHTGNTTFDDPSRDVTIYALRPLDLSAVLDAVLGDGVQPVAGHVDRVVAALGHSFGGYTMFALAGAAYDLDGIEATCAGGDPDELCDGLDEAWLARFGEGFAEPRLPAFLAMAPGDEGRFGADGFGSIAAPLFHMSASLDNDAHNDLVWSYLAAGGTGRRLRLDLVDGGHQSFTDYADVIEDVPLDRERGFRLVDAYTLAWLRAVGGDAAVEPLLDGTLVLDEAGALTVP